jgi:trans-aconitate 3-methyltransferase
MATFGKATFDTVVYASSRPMYPKQLFDFIFKYHERQLGARWDTAVDLGCGTGTYFVDMPLLSQPSRIIFLKGQATTELTPFKRVVGVDPSAKMIAEARTLAVSNAQSTNSETETKFEYVQGNAEDLSFLEDGSVDLIIAGPHIP